MIEIGSAISFRDTTGDCYGGIVIAEVPGGWLVTSEDVDQGAAQVYYVRDTHIFSIIGLANL